MGEKIKSGGTEVPPDNLVKTFLLADLSKLMDPKRFRNVRLMDMLQGLDRTRERALVKHYFFEANIPENSQVMFFAPHCRFPDYNELLMGLRQHDKYKDLTIQEIARAVLELTKRVTDKLRNNDVLTDEEEWTYEGDNNSLVHLVRVGVKKELSQKMKEIEKTFWENGSKDKGIEDLKDKEESLLSLYREGSLPDGVLNSEERRRIIAELEFLELQKSILIMLSGSEGEMFADLTRKLAGEKNAYSLPGYSRATVDMNHAPMDVGTTQENSTRKRQQPGHGALTAQHLVLRKFAEAGGKIGVILIERADKNQGKSIPVTIGGKRHDGELPCSQEVLESLENALKKELEKYTEFNNIEVQISRKTMGGSSIFVDQRKGRGFYENNPLKLQFIQIAIPRSMVLRHGEKFAIALQNALETVVGNLK